MQRMSMKVNMLTTLETGFSDTAANAKLAHSAYLLQLCIVNSQDLVGIVARLTGAQGKRLMHFAC